MTRQRLSPPHVFVLALVFAQAPLLAKDLTPMATPENDSATVSSIDDWKPKPSAHPSVAAVAPIPKTTPATPSTKTSAPPAVATSTTPAPKKAVPVAAPAPVVKKDAPSAPAAPSPFMDDAKPVAQVSSMNSMSGKVASVDSDEHAIRITVDGGFNPQFPYDDKTKVISHGKAITIDALVPGDAVTVRYIGRDMTAREIERTK